MKKKVIYIASTEEFSGKSIVTFSLALIAKDLDKKVGYFKPIGTASVLTETGAILDEDVETIKAILSLESETSLITPLILGKVGFLEDFSKTDIAKYHNEITSSYRKISKEKDIVLIEGPPTLSVGTFFGCSVPKLASEFNATVILVSRFKDDFVVDEVLQARDYCIQWGVQLFGVIINRVQRSMIKRAEEIIKPLLESNGVKIIGFIPENRILSALTVREIHDVVGGKILAGENGMNKMVQTVLIGAMTPESATRYFRKERNELIITGGDRTDIIFAALEAGTSALILTGNLYPNVKIFPRADELAVPIILVPYDTYTTLQHVQRIVGRIKPRDKKRVNLAKQLVKENVDWKQILQSD